MADNSQDPASSPKKINETSAPKTDHISDDDKLRRRRMLKGLAAGAAVPIILTLKSGAQAAANSASELCLHSVPDNSPGDMSDSRCQANEDDKVRVQRNTFATTATWVNYSGNVGTKELSPGNTGTDWCLVYFDKADGQQRPINLAAATRFGDSGSYVSLTKSCWNSFRNS